MNHQSSRRDALLAEEALGEGGNTGDFDEQADKGFEGSQDGQGIVERDASRKEAPAVK
jgi:hypothetical protein